MRRRALQETVHRTFERMEQNDHVQRLRAHYIKLETKVAPGPNVSTITVSLTFNWYLLKALPFPLAGMFVHCWILYPVDHWASHKHGCINTMVQSKTIQHSLSDQLMHLQKKSGPSLWYVSQRKLSNGRYFLKSRNWQSDSTFLTFGSLKRRA